MPKSSRINSRKVLEKAEHKLCIYRLTLPKFRHLIFFIKVKTLLKKTAARACKNLIDASTNAMLIETQENIRNWFAHCCYCTS
jgi:hypothetical protein